MKIDFDQIRELLAVVSQTDISEITIESGEEKITVKKAAPVQGSGGTTIEVPQKAMSSPPPAAMPVFEPTAVARQQDSVSEQAASNGLVPIASPMVGTFYRAPSPSAPPFVEPGDHVSIGQTVCIIEAMKLMNDLPSEVSGRIVKVCVDNGTTVEYGQPLFMVDPRG